MQNFRVAAIVCEYNPFHTGHQYQIAQTRKICGADYVIAVMSGDFVQRGEPAILNKWARTEMALQCGADLVVELPVAYALSSAQYFASGAVNLVDQMGVATHLSFGSEAYGEAADFAVLEQYARNTAQGAALDWKAMKEGRSYAAAAARNSPAQTPNDILGLEYIRALERLGSAVRPIAVKRMGAGHDQTGSARHYREQLRNGVQCGALSPPLPETAAAILEREIKQGRCPVLPENFSQAIFAALRAIGTEGLKRCPYVSEGLEYKIYSAACSCTSLDALTAACTSLRYPAARIRRILFAALLGIPKELPALPAPYIRILGMRKACGSLMDAVAAKASVPVITSKAKFLKSAGDSPLEIQAKKFLEMENRAADLYSLGYPGQPARTGDSEWTHPLVFV